jgi:hypothetical protein
VCACVHVCVCACACACVCARAYACVCVRVRARVRVLHVFVYTPHVQTKQVLSQILESMNLRMMAKNKLKFCRDGRRVGEEEATWSGGDDRWRRNLADSLVVNEND